MLRYFINFIVLFAGFLKSVSTAKNQNSPYIPSFFQRNTKKKIIILFKYIFQADVYCRIILLNMMYSVEDEQKTTTFFPKTSCQI